MGNFNKFAISFSFIFMNTALGYAVAAAADSENELAPSQVTSATQPVTQASSDLFIRNAIATVQSLDAGGAPQIYDMASVVMKNATTRQKFADDVAAANARFGRVVSREWARVERLQVASTAATVPPGSYVTVSLAAHEATGASHIEQVSFRLDDDNQWRLAGLITHRSQQAQS